MKKQTQCKNSIIRMKYTYVWFEHGSKYAQKFTLCRITSDFFYMG